MIDHKDVTLIIPHLGGTPEAEFALDKCLDALAEDGIDLPMVLVINGERECKHRNMASIQLKGQGQGLACNAGVSITNTPWVMIYHDDNICYPGWWEDFTGGFLLKKTVCMSPILVEPRPGAPTFLTEFCGGAGGDFNKAKWLNWKNEYRPEFYGSIRNGFNTPFLIKRDLWDMIGGYDINYDPWGSNGDSDFEYKIKLAGVQPKQNVNCPIYHFSQTSGTFVPENRSHWERNWQYFIDKWGFPRTDAGIWEATFNIPNKPERKYSPAWENKYFEAKVGEIS
jgi:hypothetical protein